MYPIACRPKGPANLEARILGNVIGVGEKTWDGILTANFLYVTKFNAIAGTVINIRLRASNTLNAKVAIYDDDGAGGIPRTLLGSSISTAIVAGWNIIPLTAPVVLAAGDYYLAAKADTSSRVQRASTGGTSGANTSTTYADAFPATAPALTAGTYDMAIAAYGYPA